MDSPYKRFWHPSLNGTLLESDFSFYSSKRAWWICEREHITNVKIQEAHRGHGCGYCANKRACLDNSLLEHYPVVAEEWHPRLNGVMRPSDVVSESGKKVWWLCAHNHPWRARIQDRTLKRHGCPFCTHTKADGNYNLLKCKKDLAREWHPTKNGNLSPIDVTPGSGHRVWWLCACRTAWRATVLNRVQGWSQCPSCHLRSMAIGEVA